MPVGRYVAQYSPKLLDFRRPWAATTKQHKHAAVPGGQAMGDDRDLRQKLKPVFAKFDADKSGSISTSEMGKIVKAAGF